MTLPILKPVMMLANALLIFGSCLLFTVLVPTTAHAQLSARQARALITKAGGMSLPSGSVRVQQPVMINATLAEVTADIDLVFRLAQQPSGAWRISEFRTGQDRWEELGLIAHAGGRDLPSGNCDNKDQYQRSSAGDLSVKQARCLVAELLAIDLPSDAVRIKSISGLGLPLASLPSAVAETLVRFVIRFAREGKGWRAHEFKTGRRDWIEIDQIAASVAAAKASRARDEMKIIASALERFRQDRGAFVVSDKHPALIDHLSPKYLGRVIRLDPWSNPYDYAGDRDRFTLRSAGPDGKLKTADDVVLSHP